MMTPRQKRKAKQTATKTGAVIYLRVSTSKQAASGLGLEAQEAKCREHAAKLGIPVLGVYIDGGLSGKNEVKHRPGLLGAIEALRKAPGSILIVSALSRLGRSQSLIWRLLDDRGEYGLPVSSATESFDTTTPMGRAFLGMLATFAQLEWDLASERTSDALDAAIERGTKLGAPSMVESTNDDGNRYVDPSKVAIVRHVQGLYASGKYSHRSLAEMLNDAGYASVKGAKWHARTVRVAIGTTL